MVHLWQMHMIFRDLFYNSFISLFLPLKYMFRYFLLHCWWLSKTKWKGLLSSYKVTLHFMLLFITACVLLASQNQKNEDEGKNYSALLRQKSKVKHYLNESTFNELLISRKKAMIDLREDHLSRSERSRVRRSEVGQVGEEIVWWSPRRRKRKWKK